MAKVCKSSHVAVTVICFIMILGMCDLCDLLGTSSCSSIMVSLALQELCNARITVKKGFSTRCMSPVQPMNEQ